MRRGHEFAALVYNVLVMDGRYSVKEIAGRFGMPYDTFYARIANRTSFSAEEIRLLLRLVPDVRLAAWLLEGTPFLPAARPSKPEAGENFAESIRRSSIMMLVEAGEVAHQIETAIADGMIDHAEARLIQEDIETAERALLTLREHVRRATGHRNRAGGEA